MAKQLLESGDAYPCFCTEEELEEKRKQAEAAGRPPQYDRTWRDADPAEVQRRMDAGEPYTVRFKVTPGKRVEIDDMVRGQVAWDADATVGDFILLRSSGIPVYNFCVAGGYVFIYTYIAVYIHQILCMYVCITRRPTSSI